MCVCIVPSSIGKPFGGARLTRNVSLVLIEVNIRMVTTLVQRGFCVVYDKINTSLDLWYKV